MIEPAPSRAYDLKLFLFGSPRLLRTRPGAAFEDKAEPPAEQEGEPIKFSRRKVVALLAYLATTDRPHAREILTALFWPDADPALAYSYLRRELAILNKVLGEAWLEIDRESVRLRRDDHFWLDVAHFWELLASYNNHGHHRDEVCSLCLPLLAQAIELYGDSFMAGFSLAGSEEFTEWQLFEAENLHRALLEAFDRLVRGYVGAGELNEAIRYARRWLSVDPCHEPAHRQLMKLYTWTGNRTAALNQYQDCVRLLANEIDQPPDRVTQELYEAIRSDTLSAPPQGEKAVSSKTGPYPSRFLSNDSDSPIPDHRHNLPTESAPFFGREEELAEIGRLLGPEPGCRMLTLVGPGGIGKTRLAIQAARQALTAFPGGIFLVSLAPVSSPTLLVPAIAEALDLSSGGRPDLKGQLLNYLRQRRILLLLDNFEHLLPPWSSSFPSGPGNHAESAEMILADILGSAPDLKLLVTSRERLNLREEWLFEVGGLDYPPVEETKPPAGAGDVALPRQFEAYSAVRLFIETARRTQPGLMPVEWDQAAIVKICQLVEGLPLGIELASAWVGLLSIGEIVWNIRQNLDFLESSLRNVPDRHRSLRALFEHSWQLLSDPERQLISRLSVFRGSFSHQAAENVTAASLPLLKSLIDKSLLRNISAGRYDMHEIIRQYAAGKLAESPENGKAVRARHCHYYAAFLQQREADLAGEQREPLVDIAAEIDNVQTAWNWAVAHHETDQIQRSLVSLHLFYQAQGWIQEGEAAFRQAVESLKKNPEVSHLALAQLLSRHGNFVYRLGLHRQAKKLLADSLALLQQMGPGDSARIQQEKAFALYHLGAANRVEGEYDQARQLCQESLSLYRAGHNYRGMARAIKLLGIIAGTVGDFEEARQRFQEALGIYRHLDDQEGTANTLNDLGILADRMGQYDEAKRLHQQCLAIRRKSGDLWGIGTSLNNLGLLAFAQEQYAEARDILLESLTLQEELGDQYEIANCLANLGLTLQALAEYHEARQTFLKALRFAVEIGATALVLEVIAGIATLSILSQPAEKQEAVKLLAFVAQHPNSETLTKNRAERRLAELTTQLSSEEMASAREVAKGSELALVVAEIIAEMDRDET